MDSAPVHPLATLIVLLVPLLLGRCADADPTARQPEPPPPYAFAEPDAVFELPARLREISGLTPLDSGTLGAVQDEDGEFFVLSVATGDVLRRHRFGPDGDYEGVERAGERVFVLRSDGRLFEIADWDAEEAEALHLPLPLHVSCDAEGLAYDAPENRLLIACKEAAGRGFRGYRAVYAVPLAERRLQPEPAFLVSLDSLARRLGDAGLNQRLRELARPVADVSAFKPAGLAIHPRTGHLYLVSSLQRMLAVLDRAGDLYAVWPLPERLFPQPEGIAFSPDGTMFIANEGPDGGATLLRYRYQP